MNLDGQRTNRVLLISLLIFVLLILQSMPCYGWHKTLTFVQQSSYELDSNKSHQNILSDMKFFTWYESYAIYGARETLVILKPNQNNASVEIFAYHWSIDPISMDECIQEWNTKEKCYNDIVHVRVLPDQGLMDVYCTYAHRPMVRSFDLRQMRFLHEDMLIRDSHPPMDSESSYVMLNFHHTIVTAGYQGDYIPTIRTTQGKTLLYALRPNSFFVDGFRYDGKAVFGVIETSDRSEANRVSRLVMACANRTEIVRKAILNCSTDRFDPTRAFAFHILTALVDPIRTSTGSTLLFATFTTANSSITASAVCLFMLDEQFYPVFTGPSKSTHGKTSRYTPDINSLIRNCSQSGSTTIDRDMVESERPFLSFSSNPLLIETMSTDTFTTMNAIPYDADLFCLIIGTSRGRLLTAFADRNMATTPFEELTLPMEMRSPIKSIVYQSIDSTSYVILVTHQFGYVAIKLIRCAERFCFQCWTSDCSIRKISSEHNSGRHQCASEAHTQIIAINETEEDTSNYSVPFDGLLTGRTSDEQSNNKLLFFIVAPMSFVVFVLSALVIILLTRSKHQCKRKQCHPSHQKKPKDLPSISVATDSYTYTSNVLDRTNSNRFFRGRSSLSRPFPTKTDVPIRPISYHACSTNNHHLPPLVLPTTSSVAPLLSSVKPQPLSVRRLYKSYV